MKTIALLAFLCGVSDIAFARALGCQPTPKAGDLLDCYNGIARTPSPSKRAIPKVLAMQAKTPVPEATFCPRRGLTCEASEAPIPAASQKAPFCASRAFAFTDGRNQTADAVRLYGRDAIWKDVAQPLLDNTRQQRTDRDEEDGCWPAFETP